MVDQQKYTYRVVFIDGTERTVTSDAELVVFGASIRPKEEEGIKTIHFRTSEIRAILNVDNIAAKNSGGGAMASLRE